MNDQLNSEEREILEKFKRGELRPASNVENEIKQARHAARMHLGNKYPAGQPAW